MTSTATHHLICFSHVRWNFVYQRPQHLISRFARHFTVYYVEEVVFDASHDHLDITSVNDSLHLVVPHLKKGLSEAEVAAKQAELLKNLFVEKKIDNYLFWFYNPMMTFMTTYFAPLVTVYDCTDEPTANKFSHSSIKECENDLFGKAELVFTAGHSLYELKKNRHHDVHLFPSSIDTEHYFRARVYMQDPDDQRSIPHPRIGYFGAIDERIDLALLEGIARRKPEWHFILVGPTVRINPDTLPKLPNIHYLGLKEYAQLPEYISGWDLAMVPFAHNEATRYASPNQTPEYLAAGKSVISTPITDVLRQYGRNGLVHIAGTPEEFVRVATIELQHNDRDEWMQHVNEFLSQNSWDKTWQRMMYLITRKLNDRDRKASPVTEQVLA